MKKILIVLVLLLLPCFTSSILAGNINLTTYYPSPYGSYDRLRLVPRTDLLGDCPIGTIYADPLGVIKSCKDVGGGVGAFDSIAPSYWSQSGTDIYLEDLSARVGVGINAPTSAVDVIGNLSVSSNINTNQISVNNATSQFIIASNGIYVTNANISGDITVTNIFSTSKPATATNLAVDTAATIDQLSVNSTSSHADITVSGDVVIGGDLTANGIFYPSDQKYKKNIVTISDPIAKTIALRGVSFDWKKDDQRALGFIAQEVEKVLPELVSTNHDGEKSIRYGNLVALLTEAVKQQQGQINQLMKNNQKQQNQIKVLEEKFLK